MLHLLPIETFIRFLGKKHWVQLRGGCISKPVAHNLSCALHNVLNQLFFPWKKGNVFHSKTATKFWSHIFELNNGKPFESASWHFLWIFFICTRIKHAKWILAKQSERAHHPHICVTNHFPSQEDRNYTSPKPWGAKSFLSKFLKFPKKQTNIRLVVRAKDPGNNCVVIFVAIRSAICCHKEGKRFEGMILSCLMVPFIP